MATREFAVPGHIPAFLVRDVNYFDQPGMRDDPHGAWKNLQSEDPVVWTPRNGGHWIATRGADLRAIASDHTLFSSRHASIPVAPPGVIPSVPIEADRPDHTRLKQMGIPAFGPRAIAKIEDGVRALAHGLIDDFIDRGRCEFVGEFGLHLPIKTFMKIGGLPIEDRPRLLEWIEDRTRNPDPEKQTRAYNNMIDYSRTIILDRLANPRDDLISELCNAAPGGQRASDEELLGYVTLMWFAGLDTVGSAMGFMARFLAGHPEHRRQLIEEPALINNAVEEMLRRFGVSTVARMLTRDTVYNGVEMREGEMVLLPYPLDGLDERMFADPLTVDFRRSNAAQSLIFGTGIHRCIGSFLARTELRIFLAVWLTRIPDFSLDPDDPPEATAGIVNAMVRLPLTWEVARG